jgi:adenylate cyclase
MAERNTGVAADTRIELRIGINLGDVIVEGEDLYGDGVNIAARVEALADPGGVFVSNTVYEHVRDRLPFVFEDLGEQQVKNIARPVLVYRVQDVGVAGKIPSPLALPVLALPDKPSVAVLPVTDPEQEFFADGIAEDVITALSRYPSLFVISRNSCFTYKGRAVDVKRVGRELGVRYVLEGGLRKVGNRIRVTAQLVEAETGKHVWAERYDRDLSDIFALQDEITQAVTIAIAPAIAEAELRRAMRKQPGSLDAWGTYQRGLWHLGKASVEDNALAQKFLQQAIDLDPTFAGGYSALALAQFEAAGTFVTRGLFDARRSGEFLARRAVALDGADPEGLSCLSRAVLWHGDYSGSLNEAKRALDISPNLALAHGQMGQTLIHSGRSKEGLTALNMCIRVDPHDPCLASRLNQLALGLYYSREYEAAVEAAKRATRSFADYPTPYRWLAAALGQLGRIAEAKEALEQAIAVGPASFDMYVRERVPWMRTEDHAHMLEGLRKAGWREA